MSRSTLFVIGLAGLAVWWFARNRQASSVYAAQDEGMRRRDYRPEPWALGFASWRGVQKNPDELVNDPRAIGSMDGASPIEAGLFRA